ncbi:hypothetical protein A4A49_00073 [Nicotiana attenuata]|uniref:Uncharacterized protein n=1 Tax=Nicotiana attenuata TaxID=49451 RepID=A0A1J6I1G7_NICAT|nr:hypothetical protein A4A49_00073 [Nicotiana attenuata]
MDEVILDRFSSGDATGWISRAERYFHFLGFSEEYWLPLPYFYLEGAALVWFDWLYRNKQFYDWNHFKEKLKLHFRAPTSASPVRMADSQDAKELLNECFHHGEDGEFNVLAMSIFAESLFSTRNDPKVDDAYSNAHFIAPPIVVDLVADKSARLPFSVTQMLGGNIESVEIDLLETKSVELKTTKLQCQFANVALLETAKYVSTEILSAHFDEPIGNEGVTSLLIHKPVADEDDEIVEFFPYIFKQPSLTLVLNDFRDLAMNMKYVLHTCNWFDTGQHASNEVVSALLTAKRRKGCHWNSAHHKGARDNRLPICSYVDSCFATGHILWACFNMAELCVPSLLRQVQLIGYLHGFQVLNVAAASSGCKHVSWRVDIVISLQPQHFLIKFNGCKGFITSHLSLLLLASDKMVDSTPARSERLDFIDPSANFFIVTIRATATNLCVWDPGISFKSKSLTCYTATTDFSADALAISPHLGVVLDATGKVLREGTAQVLQGVIVGQTGVNLRAQVTFALIVVFNPGGGPSDAPILEDNDGVLEAILKAIANLSICIVPLSVDNFCFHQLKATIHDITKSEYGLSLYGFYFIIESHSADSIRVTCAFLIESYSADIIRGTGAPDIDPEVKGIVESIVEHFSSLSRKSNGQLINMDLRVVILENKCWQGNCASRSKNCYGPQNTTMYFKNRGFTKDTSTFICLKARRDYEQFAYNSAKSLWPSLCKIAIPSLEISEGLPFAAFVALLEVLVAQLALVMEGVLVFLSTWDGDELDNATYIPRFVLVIEDASVNIITRTTVASTYGTAGFFFICKWTCQSPVLAPVDVYIATISLPLFLVERLLDSNLEDKVLIEDGGIVMNQLQTNRDINTQIAIGLRRAIGPRTSNRARLIWDLG